MTEEKASQDKILEEYEEMQKEQAKLEQESVDMRATSVTFRDYAATSEFDGRNGIF